MDINKMSKEKLKQYLNATIVAQVVEQANNGLTGKLEDLKRREDKIKKLLSISWGLFMSFFTIATLFVVGVIIGFIYGELLFRDEYQSESRKSLEKALIESKIVERLNKN